MRLRRGEVWVAPTQKPSQKLRADPEDAGVRGGKPSPVVILQDENLVGDAMSSVTLCRLTSKDHGEPIRVRIEPSGGNGLDKTSWVMVDKITTMDAKRLDKKIGQLDGDDMARVDQAVAMFLGLTALVSENR